MLNHLKIRQLRRFFDLTMEELAKKVGYSSTNAIWKVEHGEVDLPLSKAEKIARTFGVSVDELLLVEALDEEFAKIKEAISRGEKPRV